MAGGAEQTRPRKRTSRPSRIITHHQPWSRAHFVTGEGKPPRVDAMKCYMMGPHKVGGVMMAKNVPDPPPLFLPLALFRNLMNHTHPGHQVGFARELYWDAGSSLEDQRVVAVATGRNHMACIATTRATGSE